MSSIDWTMLILGALLGGIGSAVDMITEIKITFAAISRRVITGLFASLLVGFLLNDSHDIAIGYKIAAQGVAGYGGTKTIEFLAKKFAKSDGNKKGGS